MGLKVSDSMIVGDISLTANYVVSPLQNIQFLTAWLPEDWFWKKIECPLPDFMIVGTWTLMKTEHQISDRMLVRNLVHMDLR